MRNETVQIINTLAGEKWAQMGDGKLLCMAVETAYSHEPVSPKLSVILEEVRQQSGRSSGAVYKAMERACTDIWENGDRGELTKIFGRPLEKKPTVKELVLAISFYLWVDD